MHRRAETLRAIMTDYHHDNDCLGFGKYIYVHSSFVFAISPGPMHPNEYKKIVTHTPMGIVSLSLTYRNGLMIIGEAMYRCGMCK
jgi:hypothetical protein